jgi:hypothetical protein
VKKYFLKKLSALLFLDLLELILIYSIIGLFPDNYEKDLTEGKKYE